jgi:hypothetical protein
METVFDQLGGDDVVWQIDKLEVDVGNVTEAELPGALAAGLRTALAAVLHEGGASMAGDAAKPGMDGGGDGRIADGTDAGTAGGTGRNASARRGDDRSVLLAFLATGTMPWRVDATATASHEALLSRILAQEEQGVRDFLLALAASAQRATMLARLARQFAPAQLQALLRKMDAGHADAVLSQLTDLQELLQGAALARTTLNGALHAAWEEALAAGLDGAAGGRGSAQGSARAALPQALTRRALDWLARQQHQSIAAAATQVLRDNAIHRGDKHIAGDILQALRELASAAQGDRKEKTGRIAEEVAGEVAGDPVFPSTDTATTVPNAQTIVETAAATTATATTAGAAAAAADRQASAPFATGNETTVDGLPQEWQALVRHRNDGTLLKRLVQQSPLATMPAILQRFNPHHAKAMLAQLDALQGVLARLSLSSPTLRTALSAAWEYVLAASLAQPSQLPATVPLLERVIAVLATEQPAAEAGVGTEARTEIEAGPAGMTSRALALARLREAGAALGDPAGLATALAVMETMPGRPTASSSAPAASASAENTARDVEPRAAESDAIERDAAAQRHAPKILREPLSAVVAVRNRITSALMGGKAGSIYDDWRAFQDSQPDLLRSALLHYGGYGEIREKMASTFPLSLLLDMQALLAPAAAALTERVWNDEQLHMQLGMQSAEQWRHWRRNWWRGAVTHLLQAAQSQEAPAASPDDAIAFDTAAYIAAALKAASGSDEADQKLTAYVTTLAEEEQWRRSQELQEAQRRQGGEESGLPKLAYEPTQDAQEKNARADNTARPAEPSPATTLASLFDAIRNGLEPLRTFTAGTEQLERWVREAVREPSFYQAIADHAALARDRRAYYVEVLQALAQNRIVDLEQFAAVEGPAPETMAADPAPFVRPGAAKTAAMPAAASAGAGRLDERDKTHLVNRLAKALMKGDPASLYADWDVLLHRHAPLLEEALRHYGVSEDILERIVRSFPESMVYDMAVLLAPGALPAWRQLRDQAAWAEVLKSGLAPGIAAAQSTLPAGEGDSQATDSDPALPAPEALAAWKRQFWKAALRQLLQSLQDRQPDGNAAADDPASRAPAPTMDIAAIPALASALADDAELGRLPWQRRVLMRWADLSTQQEDSRTAKTGDEDEDIRAILDHHRRLSMSATQELPEAAVADLRQRFARLKNDPAAIGVSWAAADIERIVATCILAQAAEDVSPQQQETFLQAIKTQAPAASTPDRARYFRAVLQALLQEQMLDLEEIADASSSAQEGAQGDATIREAGKQEDMAERETGQREGMPAYAAGNDAAGSETTGGETTGGAADRAGTLHQAYIDFLLSPDFQAGATLPAGLREWLRNAVDPSPTPEIASIIVPALTQLSRQPQAAARLLDLLPASSWPRLAALAPHSALQMQRMRRYAGDACDMFAEQNRQLSAAALARFEWRFLLPYLFAADRIFEPVRFTNELLGFLARESGLPAPAGLAARLRNQMGIAVTSPQAVSRAVAPARTQAQAPAGIPAHTPAHAPTPAPAPISRPTQMPNDPDAALQGTAIHVANAGMVLIWPFLSRAWQALDLVGEGKFVDDASAQRAAWLLQFAVDEQTAVPEYQLTLNKLLSGIPLQAPIVPEIDVTEQERNLVEQMLTAAISHWKAIGNTSIQGLRETFLQRDGYLSRQEDAWRLHIPKQTFDMLLDKLPWSISTIRLPWMETILRVEWT